MTTLHEAAIQDRAPAAGASTDGAPPLVDGVDVVLCDEGAQVFLEVYLVDDALTDGAPLFAIADLPRRVAEDTFDPAAFVAAFWAAGAPSLARN